jgi:hypothetical protein
MFKKLNKDLSHVEIIPYEDGSIWFIDRNDKYWYLEFKKTGFLWWRYDFFERFFSAFSLDRINYEPLIAEWVEDVLNHKVNTTVSGPSMDHQMVVEVLNHKVNTTCRRPDLSNQLVEQVLNHKVITTYWVRYNNDSKVEQVLNSK